MGGMGVYISGPPLVNKFSKVCQEKGYPGLGTVSCTAAERIMVLILQRGDQGGHFRRALAHFPFADVTERVLNNYYDPSGLGKKSAPMYRTDPSKNWIDLAVTASFAFVWLAKEGHDRPVSANWLGKIGGPLPYQLAGAYMAGVDVVSMGAGILFDVPRIFDALLANQTLTYPIPVIGEKESFKVRFNPSEFFGRALPPRKRPAFIPVISSVLLAKLYLKHVPRESIQGFVVEEPTAGGHNAPPREKHILNDYGEPIYGKRDEVDYAELSSLGLPFWIGGSCASRERIFWAQSVGAVGVQVGSSFALCRESGMNGLIREDICRRGFNGNLRVHTSPIYSPTGYPFKVAVLPDTLSEEDVYKRQVRACTEGALAVAYRKPDGSIGFRCPSEPVQRYLAKGGRIEDTVGRRCLCRGLIATAGLIEKTPPIVTIGDDLGFLPDIMQTENDTFGVKVVLDYLFG